MTAYIQKSTVANPVFTDASLSDLLVFTTSNNKILFGQEGSSNSTMNITNTGVHLTKSMGFSNSSNVFSFNIDQPSYLNIVGAGLMVGGTQLIASDGTFNTSLITLGGGGSNPVAGADIIDGSITTVKLAPWAAASNIASATLDGTVLIDGTVTTAKLAPWAAASNISSATLSGTVLIDGTVTTAKLAPWAAASNISSATLSGTVIIDGTVTTAKLAPWASASNIATGTLSGSALIDGSVNSNQLADASVVFAKLSSALQSDVTQSIATYSNLSHLAKNAVDTVDYLNMMYAFFYAL